MPCKICTQPGAWLMKHGDEHLYVLYYQYRGEDDDVEASHYVAVSIDHISEDEFDECVCTRSEACSIRNEHLHKHKKMYNNFVSDFDAIDVHDLLLILPEFNDITYDHVIDKYAAHLQLKKTISRNVFVSRRLTDGIVIA